LLVGGEKGAKFGGGSAWGRMGLTYRTRNTVKNHKKILNGGSKPEEQRFVGKKYCWTGMAIRLRSSNLVIGGGG